MSRLISLAKAGYTPLEPSFFVQADIVRHVSGEELSSKLFLTQESNGVELALRHDYTLPLTLHFLNSSLEKANYCYSGPVFRQGEGERKQSGVESFGRLDKAQADAESIALALETAGAHNKLKMGDISLFLSLVKALDLPQAWQMRVIKQFRKHKPLTQNSSTLLKQFPGLLAAIEGQNEEVSQLLIQDLLKIAGIKTNSGRSVQEISARFSNEARLLASPVDPQKIELLNEALRLQGTPLEVYEQLTRLIKKVNIDMPAALESFNERLEALKACGVAQEQLHFALNFAREPDYYDGLVFEIYQDNTPKPILGGGRYDKMTLMVSSFLGTQKLVPAVGFAIFNEEKMQ